MVTNGHFHDKRARPGAVQNYLGTHLVRVIPRIRGMIDLTIINQV
jgi:hypothetical protein